MQIDINNPKKPFMPIHEGSSDLWYYHATSIILYMVLLSVSYSNFVLTLVMTLLTAMVMPLLVYIQIKRFKDTYQWQKHKATVIKKGVVRYHCNATTGYLSWSDMQNPQPYYGIDIKYRYTLNETEYISTQYTLEPYCNWHYSFEKAQKIATGIPHEIDVYVNPQDPTQAVVKQGVSKQYHPSYLMAILLYNAPIYMIFYVIHWG